MPDNAATQHCCSQHVHHSALHCPMSGANTNSSAHHDCRDKFSWTALPPRHHADGCDVDCLAKGRQFIILNLISCNIHARSAFMVSARHDTTPTATRHGRVAPTFP